MLALTLFGCVGASHKQDSHSSSTTCIGDHETDAIVDTAEMALIDSLALSGYSVNDTIAKDTVADPGIAYRTLKQIELKIPHAADSIALAISRFSPEYQDWTFSLRIHSTDPNNLKLVGEPDEKYLGSVLHKYFIEKKGYLTINGIDMDFEVFHRSGNFNDLNVDSLFEYTGRSKTFKYIKDPLIIVDNCVEYHLGITDSALVLKNKIEHW